MKFFLRFIGLLAAFVLPAFLAAQNKDDDRYVRLMSAQSVSTMEENGKTFRKAEGPARFLHNNTWLICDTAIWDVDLQVIYALGNVSIEQDETELRSDKLTYFIEEDLAQFRGSVVELIDKDQNILRTRNLDYNTKDSVAVFRSGASMKDKDGQIIESIDGTYDSKAKMFTFENDVNMFSDSVFVKTTKLLYYSNHSLATFPNYVDAWQQDRMFSGGSGHYNNENQIFFMTDDVHSMTPTQECWSDSLYFYRKVRELELLGNAQLTDSARATTGLAGFIHYRDSLSFVTMTLDPLLLGESEEKDSAGVSRTDTTYMRADTLLYWKVMKMNLDSADVADAQARLKELADDPIANMRAKAAEEAERRRREAMENNPNAPPQQKAPGKTDSDKAGKEESGKENPDKGSPKQMPGKPEAPKAPVDSLGVTDSLGSALRNAADSLAGTDSLALHDTLPPAKTYTKADSVEYAYIRGVRNVKVFRKSMQVVCDSLVYTDIDSLARMYKEPAVWNSPQHQYNADSIFVAIHDGRMDRANLLSNAFIHIEEERDRFYDQIKGTEMTAFFDENGEMTRFDALGGANAIFYMKEKDEISMANRSEATMLSATFIDGDLATISYYENPQSNAYPIPQMGKDNQYLKGFSWTPDRRPTSVLSLSSRKARASQRAEYLTHPKTKFIQTDIYFPGYMAGIYRQIEIGDSLRVVHEERRRLKEERGKAIADSLRLAAADSVVLADSLAAGKDSLMLNGPDSLALAGDSLKAGSDSLALADSLAAGRDSLALNCPDSLATGDSLVIKTEKQLKAEERERIRAEKRAEREAKKKARQEALEAKWAAQDARDALKQAAKDARKRKKKEERLRYQVERLEKEKAREDALIRKYKEEYLSRMGKTARNASIQHKPSKSRSL